MVRCDIQRQHGERKLWQEARGKDKEGAGGCEGRCKCSRLLLPSPTPRALRAAPVWAEVGWNLPDPENRVLDSTSQVHHSLSHNTRSSAGCVWSFCKIHARKIFLNNPPAAKEGWIQVSRKIGQLFSVLMLDILILLSFWEFSCMALVSFKWFLLTNDSPATLSGQFLYSVRFVYLTFSHYTATCFSEEVDVDFTSWLFSTFQLKYSQLIKQTNKCNWSYQFYLKHPHH